jgi:hypothetical protein
VLSERRRMDYVVDVARIGCGKPIRTADMRGMGPLLYQAELYRGNEKATVVGGFGGMLSVLRTVYWLSDPISRRRPCLPDNML